MTPILPRPRALLLAALVSLLAAARARAALPEEARDAAPSSPGPTPAAAPPQAATAPAPAMPSTPPPDAATALERARAAYEYGEMDMVADSARLVAEGRVHPTPAQRAQALRYLGIALFLTGRQEGAETAFFDLLRLRPRARLDATTTRPDVVAFFESVRRRHADAIDEAARKQPGKSLALALLPPVGQFQSGHKARGITIAAIEAVSAAGAIGTYLQLRSWQNADHTFGPPPGTTGPDHTDDARTLKAFNWVSIGVLITTVIVGAIDGVASYYAVEPEDLGTPLADVFGRGLRF